MGAQEAVADSTIQSTPYALADLLRSPSSKSGSRSMATWDVLRSLPSYLIRVLEAGNEVIRPVRVLERIEQRMQADRTLDDAAHKLSERKMNGIRPLTFPRLD